MDDAPKDATASAASADTQSEKRILMGEVVAPQGVKGRVKILSFTENPGAIGGYTDSLTSEDGSVIYKFSKTGHWKSGVFAEFDGVTDRDAAEAMRGTKLYATRDILPDIKDEDSFYISDLIGMECKNPRGKLLGHVVSAHDFGAGDMIEVRAVGQKKTVLLPFTKEVVPKVNVDQDFLVLVPPEVLWEDAIKKPSKDKKKKRHRSPAAKRRDERRGYERDGEFVGHHYDDEEELDQTVQDRDDHVIHEDHEL